MTFQEVTLSNALLYVTQGIRSQNLMLPPECGIVSGQLKYVERLVHLLSRI